MVRWSKWFIVIVVIVMGGAGMFTARAQDDGERVRYIVEQWLLKKLGKPNLILINYEYSGASWEDSSLGCPVADETYTPETIHGLKFFLLYDNFVRYEVHASMDTSLIVLCSSRSTSPDVSVSTYTSLTFTVLSPDAWVVFPNDDQTEVLFAPQEQLACDQPGMRVRVMGRVASGITPDQLLDEYLTNNNLTDSPAERSTIGSFGRSTGFQNACDASTQRVWRVTAFVQYGSAYLVEQWSPESEAERWADLFVDMVNQFGPSDAATLAPAAPSSASTEEAASPAELAALPLAHVFVGDVFVGALNHIPGRGVTTVPTVDRRYLSFSPDGLLLGFIDVTNGEVRVLNAVDGRSARKIAENVDSRFPLAWSADSREVAYVASSDSAPLEIRAVPVSGGEPRALAMFEFGGDCPSTLSDPADRPYLADTGSGNALVWLPGDQFLISTGCNSGIGLLTLADGKVTTLGDDLRGGVIAPDWKRFLTRSDQGLVVLDLEQWKRIDLTTSAPPQQIAWGVDGQTVYYAGAVPADSVTLDDPGDRERGESVFGGWPVTVTVYAVSLGSVDITTGKETILWQGQGRGIGRIAPAPDGSGILYSLIPSGQPVLEVFRSGADPLSAREVWPQPALYWLYAGDSTPRLLAYSGQPAFAPITVSTASQ